MLHTGVFFLLKKSYHTFKKNKSSQKQNPFYNFYGHSFEVTAASKQVQRLRACMTNQDHTD